VEKSSPKFGLFQQFSKKLPKENNRPIGENTPNLVTLLFGQNFSFLVRKTSENISAKLDRFNEF
jgi:hypothetical protein